MNTAYPLFSISILIVLFYALSSAFVGMGLVTRANHRKFWNVLLLFTFLVTGLIGLLMVVKINYKLKIPYYDDLLGYHVEFGIGMVLIGIVHFWWHLNYYLRLLKYRESKVSVDPLPVKSDLEPIALKKSALLLGSTSMIAQIILLREFLSVFNGNELVIGLVLSNWMVLTGIGAYLGKHPLRIKKSSTIIFYGLLILSVLPFITTFLINFLKNKIFPVGEMINVYQTFFASLFLLTPFCLISGYLFTFIAGCYSETQKKNEIGSVYGLESLGSILGGLCSGLIFIFVFSSVESLLVLAVINGFLLFLISLKKGGPKLALSAIVFLSSLILLFFQPEKRIRSYIYPNQQIDVSKDSPYGNIVITRREKMWSVYNNNLLLFDSENFMWNEEAVSFAMLQRTQPSHVLLVSGGLSGQIAELKKYNPLSVDYVEDNRWLLALMKDSLKSMMTNRISLYTTDPLIFIRNTTKKYDVALINLPGPSTLQTNRFYTLEFFILLKKKLNDSAVFSFGLPAPANYLNSEAVNLNSTLYVTLKKIFQNVLIIPGEKNYFLASDGGLTYNLIRAVQERKIQNLYVNQDYFNDLYLKSRGETIRLSLNSAAEINRNLKPVLYQQQLAYWLSYFGGKYWLMAGVAGALALFVFFTGSTPSKVMFLTGFSATGLEILLLFGLQIFFGNIYLLTSFVFTGFMLGLAAGSFSGRGIKSTSLRESLPAGQIAIGVFAAIAGILLFSPLITNLAPAIVYTLFLAAILVTGTLTGFQFTTASLNQTGSYTGISGNTYSYDLIGSALGALVLTIYLVPNIGIIASAIAISFLNILFGIYLTLRYLRGVT